MPGANTQRPQAAKPKDRKLLPNYNFIHRNLLPIPVYSLPPLIPHNPVSLVAIFLSYVLQVVNPPPRSTHKAYFSSATSSVHVTDPASIRALWEMGFFGRGNLSRSEPTWLQTQNQKGSTAEENTGKRRGERRQQKLERAKLEQEVLVKQLSIERGLDKEIEGTEPKLHSNSTTLDPNHLSSIASRMDNDQVVTTTQVSQVPGFDEWKSTLITAGLPTPPPTITSSEPDNVEGRPTKKLQRSKSVRFSPTIEAREFDLSSPVVSPIKAPGSTTSIESTSTTDASADAKDKEHLHLSLEEAFFLSYGLGVLDVFCENTEAIFPTSSLLSLFRRHSYLPPRSLSARPEPDDPFMVSYVVYHHYRSLGWVVRSGVKFSTDYLLYNRGPAFSHAEFAVVIVPSYSDTFWNANTMNDCGRAEQSKKTWWWLHGVNRVQAQVHKHLVLCYVEIPPPLNSSATDGDVDIGRLLTRYKIRDIGIRRWTPNRSRD